MYIFNGYYVYREQKLYSLFFFDMQTLWLRNLWI
jgi:hypothetical protein